MAQYSFDQFDSGNSYEGRNDKPVWEVGFTDETELLKWLNTEFNDLENNGKEWVNDIKKHIALYKGIQYYSQEARTSRRDREEVMSKFKQKTVVNHLYDITEQKVSRIVKYKPNISILPKHDEQQDRYSAKIAKMAFDHVAKVEHLDAKLQKAVRDAVITGEGWLFIEWDPDKGDEIQASKKIREKDLNVPLVDEEGKEVKDFMGKPAKIGPSAGPINQGDVTIELVRAHRVFPERKRNYSDCTFLFKTEIVELDVLRNRYPKKADKIKQDKDASYFDFTNYEETKMVRETYVYHFYFKKTREVPKGRYIKFTKDVILENRELPYSHGEFPCVRLVEIDIPEELRGRGSYINGRQLQAHVNNLTSMGIRNQYMAAHPKWFVPHGSVKLEALGNDMSVVQYRGATHPYLQQANPTGKETYELRKLLIEEMGQIMGVRGVARGEPPTGIKAGVALQYLNEQDHERQNAFAANYNEYIRLITKKALSTMADFYQDDDERIINIVGKNNEYMKEYLDPKHLTKPYDIVIQNASALPQTLAARTQQIIDLNEAFPGMFTQEQIIDMLDLGKSDRFLDEATVAVRAAEDTYEDMVDGKEVDDPKEYEDHIQYWKVFSAKIQEPTFKKLEEETKQTILDYLMTREMMMYDKALRSPAYQEKIGSLVSFPLLFEPEVPEAPMDIPPEELPPEEEMPMPPQGVPPEGLARQQAVSIERAPMEAPQITPGTGTAVALN